MLPVLNLAEVKKSGNTTINLLVYGDSGVGKTTLAATAAELGKVLYVDAESGSKFINEKYAKNIDILKIDDISILDEVLKPDNIKEYKVVVLDSITEIMKKLVDKAKGNKEKPSLSDWGNVINEMETYFRRFRDLDKHIILVALSQEKGDEDLVLRRPSLSGKSLPADLVGIVDICLYLENTQNGRVAYSQPSPKFYAKDRTNTLPEKISGENLNIKFISDKATSKPSQMTDEQAKEIFEGIDKLRLDSESIVKMAEYGGADSIEELSEKGAEKIILAIRKKLETFKEPQKEEVKPVEKQVEVVVVTEEELDAEIMKINSNQNESVSNAAKPL